MSADDKDKEFLALALDRFKLAIEAEATLRRDALDDLQFSIGEQWPSDIKADRQLNGRPCLTVNVLPQFIKQVTNEQRQQRPAGTINPVGDGADIDTAEILQGVVRHIEVGSDAEVADDYAFEYMVRVGFGYERLDTRLIQGSKSDQEICVRLIRNPFCVYVDPNAQELDRCDAKWGFLVEDVPLKEFQQNYPNSQLVKGGASLSDYQSVGDMTPGWASTAGPLPTVRVAEYWYFENPTDKEMKWAKITAMDVLDREDTIWDSVPLLGVYGDDLIVNGKMHQAGLVRFAKDPQRAKNYWTSAATEMIALAPKAPWIGAVGQFKSKQRQWEQANYRNFAYLEYDPVNAGGQAMPPPQRNAVEPPIQAMNEMLQLATLDLQATTRLNDANLGMTKRPDESGKAVLARQNQGNVATLDYSDNMSRMIRRRTRMILKAIPKVYTAPKIQRIIKPDTTISQAAIFNSQNDSEEKATAALQKINPELRKVYDIGVGTYDVTVSVGPSYPTKRKEAVQTQMALVQADPNLIGIIGDILVGNMDIPGAQEISKRLKKVLPPALQDSDDPEAQQQQLVAQHAQLTQQVQLLTGALQQAQQKIETKQVEMQARLAIEQYKADTDLALQKAKIDAQVAIAEINTKAQNALERARMYNEVWTELHGSAHELGLQQDQQAHEQGMAQMAAANQAQQTQLEAQQPQNGNGQ
jgi:hypothetical protein